MTKARRTPDQADSPHTSQKKVLLVDDHPIVRRGLVQLLNQEADLTVCAEVGTEEEAMKAIPALKPDLAMLDISLNGSSGLELTKNIHLLYPKLPILVLSMHDETLYAERALRAGALGYVMKQEPPDVLLHAIRMVLANKRCVSEKMTARLLAEMMQGEKPESNLGGVERLSDRELEIFEQIGRGLPTREIAAVLHISVKTVETHYARIKLKLDAQSGTELMHRAMHWVHDLNGEAGKG
jgi:DNA-binding NarL/FixJ family response regulator